MPRPELTPAQIRAAARSLAAVGGLYEPLSLLLLEDHKEILMTDPSPAKPPALPRPRRRIRLELTIEADDYDGLAAVLDDVAALATIWPDELPTPSTSHVQAGGSVATDWRAQFTDAGPEMTHDRYTDALAAYRRATTDWSPR